MHSKLRNPDGSAISSAARRALRLDRFDAAQPAGQTPQPACDLFSDADLDLLSEFLRIAQADILWTASTAAARGITATALLESLRKHAELAADLRERIEAR